jgi:hypothetical protein
VRLASFLPLLVCACGLTARGSGTPDGGEGGEELGPDASAAGEGGAADGGGDTAPVDSGPPCEVAFDEPFSTVGFDTTKWLVTSNESNAGYPVPRVVDRPLVAMLDETKLDARGGVWYKPIVPFTAFDVDIDLEIKCLTNCGDGFAVVFVDPATETRLDSAQASLTIGIPGQLNGGAVALNLAENQGIGDTASPNMQVLELDATKVPGQHAWVLSQSPQNFGLRNTSLRVAMSLRDKQVTVKVNGSIAIQGAMPRLPAEGTFGFVASSGGYTSAPYFGDLHAKFYRCNAP